MRSRRRLPGGRSAAGPREGLTAATGGWSTPSQGGRDGADGARGELADPSRRGGSGNC